MFVCPFRSVGVGSRARAYADSVVQSRRWGTNRGGSRKEPCPSRSLRVSRRSRSSWASCDWESSAMTSRSSRSASSNSPRFTARLAVRGRTRSRWSGPDVLAVGFRLWRRLRFDLATDDVGDDFAKGLRRDRLRQEIDRTQLHRRDGVGDAAVGGQHHDGRESPSARRRRRVSMPSILGIRRSSTTRSHGDRGGVRAPGSVRGLAHLVAGGFQRGPQHEPHVRLVVDDQDAFRWEHVSWTFRVGRIVRIAASREGERERRPLSRHRC